MDKKASEWLKFVDRLKQAIKASDSALWHEDDLISLIDNELDNLYSIRKID